MFAIDSRPPRGAAPLAAAAVLAVVAAAAGQEPAPPAVPGEAFRFGPYRATIDGLAAPADVAIAADGSILVAEAGAGRIGRFAPDGARIGSFGAAPAGAEGIVPLGLAVLADGTVLVADGAGHRVVAFDAGGAILRTWGRHGRGDGAFNEPRGIAADAERVYVADLGNDRVQVFDHAGRFQFAIGSRGDGEGRFNRPVDVAVDGAGSVYVADADHDRIQKFDATGRFERAWGDWGPFIGLMDEPSAVVCRDGEVYVADTRNHRVQIFDAEGELLLQWGIHAVRLHEGEGRLHYPNAMAIDPTGSFGVICESFEGRCQIFEAGDPRQPKPARAVAIKAKQSHFGASLDVDGTLLVIAEPETHLVHVFDTRGEVPILIGSFGERGTKFGQVIRAAGLEVDAAAGRLSVTDTATRRVQVFSVDHDPAEPVRFSPRRVRFVKAFDLERLAADRPDLDLAWAIEPLEIERGPDGRLYLVDPRNSMILVLSPDLDLEQAWGGYGTAPGRFRRPTDVAFSRDGRTAFVVDSDNRRVQALDLDGRPRGPWGDAAAGRLRQPYGIAAGRDGFVYVTDAAADRILRFTEAGELVGEWGGHGVEHGQLWTPRGIEQDDRLRLFVVDQGNHRAQIFSPEGEWLVTCGTGRSFTPERLRLEREMRERREAGG